MKFGPQMIADTGSSVGGVIQKDIEWVAPGGKRHKAQVNVMPIAYDTMLAIGRMEGDIISRRVVASIVDDDGEPLLTMAHIMGDAATKQGRMCDSLFIALVNAVQEANEYGEK